MVGQLGLGFAPEPRADRDLSQWDTRPETARDLVRWAGVQPGDAVLEPSAGKGNIVAELVRARARVVVAEIDPSRVEILRQRFLGSPDPSPIHCADFLDLAARIEQPSPIFDAVVGNPPYEDGLDLEFTLASLRLTTRVVFLLRLAFLEGKERRDRLWRKYRLARLKVLSERESFDGDTDGTPKSPMAYFDIRHGNPQLSLVEWR